MLEWNKLGSKRYSSGWCHHLVLVRCLCCGEWKLWSLAIGPFGCLADGRSWSGTRDEMTTAALHVIDDLGIEVAQA